MFYAGFVFMDASLCVLFLIPHSLHMLHFYWQRTTAVSVCLTTSAYIYCSCQLEFRRQLSVERSRYNLLAHIIRRKQHKL